MGIAAVRGATQAPANSPDDIRIAAVELVQTLLRENGLNEEQIVSVVFSQTDDLDRGNPAQGLRSVGFAATPLFCTREPNYPNALPRAIRVLMTVQRPEKDARQMKPVYLHAARALRPDLVQ